MDDLIDRLRNGVVEHAKRWSGDTHDDLGGSADYAATDAIMSEAAAALTEAQATIARLEAALRAADDYLDKGLDQMARNVTRAALSPGKGARLERHGVGSYTVHNAEVGKRYTFDADGNATGVILDKQDALSPGKGG